MIMTIIDSYLSNRCLVDKEQKGNASGGATKTRAIEDESGQEGTEGSARACDPEGDTFCEN